MHLLDDGYAQDRVQHDLPANALSATQNSSQTASQAPSMDHLDALEAQSIYIFREAFARLKKLALLWSLGKDSNVMIWLARKAFFGRVPFPALHVDTGKKFPEVFRIPRRLGQGRGARSEDRPMPATGERRSDLAAGRPVRRPQDRRAEARTRQIWLRRVDRGHSPRRRGHPRQGAGVLAARHRGRMGCARPAAGILGS